jgi:short-subunit dehydrogenase
VQLIKKAETEFGKIDIWINNAGLGQTHKYFWEIDNEQIKQVIDVNVYGLMLGTKFAINLFKKQGHGIILNMQGFGSNGRIMEKLTLYGTGKRAVNYFTKSVAKELKNSSIKIGTINPGMVRTDLLNKSMKEVTESERKRYEKVYRILAEDADVVAAFLSNEILKGKTKIKFLSGFKLMTKILRLVFS